MLTINAILKEIKDVPVNRLEELYQFIRSLTPTKKRTEEVRNKILSFGGAFSDMTNKDYTDFKSQTQMTRKNLFKRNIDL